MPCPGVELLQPSTALAGLALFALLYSALARMWSARRAPLKQILEKHPLPHEEEAQLQASFLACKPVMMGSGISDFRFDLCMSAAHLSSAVHKAREAGCGHGRDGIRHGIAVVYLCLLRRPEIVLSDCEHMTATQGSVHSNGAASLAVRHGLVGSIF